MALNKEQNSTGSGCEYEEDHCTETKCKDDDDGLRVKCTSCKRTLHYACTGLPAYQLQFFIKKGKRKFSCITCCPGAKELSKNIYDQSQRITSSTYSNKEIKACENIIKAKNENEAILSAAVKKLKSKCRNDNDQEKLLSEEIKSQFATLESKLMQKIEGSVYKNKIRNEKPVKAKKTFADVTMMNKDHEGNLKSIKEVIRSEKIEDQLEEQRKRAKQSNIIIHGVPESDDEDHDTRFINKLLDDTGSTEQEVYLGRIGQASNSKTSQRPMKVVFCNVEEKHNFMQSLTILKGIKKYAKISITDDLTRTERELIKLWKNKADQRNKADKNDYVWRVRGSPRESRGLYLKKIFTRPSI